MCSEAEYEHRFTFGIDVAKEPYVSPYRPYILGTQGSHHGQRRYIKCNTCEHRSFEKFDIDSLYCSKCKKHHKSYEK